MIGADGMIKFKFLILDGYAIRNGVIDERKFIEVEREKFIFVEGYTNSQRKTVRYINPKTIKSIDI